MDIKTLDHQYVANTYKRFPVEIVSGHGSVVTNRDGKDYIDLGTGMPSTPSAWATPVAGGGHRPDPQVPAHLQSLLYRALCPAGPAAL